jgi:hypothetical protein
VRRQKSSPQTHLTERLVTLLAPCPAEPWASGHVEIQMLLEVETLRHTGMYMHGDVLTDTYTWVPRCDPCHTKEHADSFVGVHAHRPPVCQSLALIHVILNCRQP